MLGGTLNLVQAALSDSYLSPSLFTYSDALGGLDLNYL